MILLVGSSLVLGSVCTLRLAGAALPPQPFVPSLDQGLLLHEQICGCDQECIFPPLAGAPFLDKKSLTTVSRALVRSSLRYVLTLYVGLILGNSRQCN